MAMVIEFAVPSSQFAVPSSQFPVPSFQFSVGGRVGKKRHEALLAEAASSGTRADQAVDQEDEGTDDFTAKTEKGAKEDAVGGLGGMRHVRGAGRV